MRASNIVAEGDYISIAHNAPFGPEISVIVEGDDFQITVKQDESHTITLTRDEAAALATWIRCALL